MRRKQDSYINATQILRAAGLPKPQRTKVLERDVVSGVHEKVQGGYAGFQGTWIPLEIAMELADVHGVKEEMMVLFEYDIDSGVAESNETAPHRRGRPGSAKVKVSDVSSSSDVDGFERPKRSAFKPSRFNPISAASKSGRGRRKRDLTSDTADNDSEIGLGNTVISMKLQYVLNKKLWGIGQKAFKRVLKHRSRDVTSTDSDGEDDNPYDDIEFEPGSTPWQLKLESRRLRHKAKDLEKSERKLKRLLLEAKLEDRHIDRQYRKLVGVVKQVSGGNEARDEEMDDIPGTSANMVPITTRLNGENQNDRQIEQDSLFRFVNTVKGDRLAKL